MKVRVDKSKVMALGREEGLDWNIVDGTQVEHVSEFKYLGCVWRSIIGAIRLLVNARGLQ